MMLMLLLGAALAQATATQTIRFTIVGLPPDAPVHTEAGGPLPGHWLDTLAAEGDVCQAGRIGCWTSIWVQDAPVPAPEPAPDAPTPPPPASDPST